MKDVDCHVVMKRYRLATAGFIIGTFVLATITSSGAAEVRPSPLRDLPAGKVIRVADFGAKANDGEDDLTAIQAAIDEARGIETPVRIVLGEGRFDLQPTGDGGTALRIVHQQNFVLDGDGAEVVIHNPKMGFIAISVSTSVIVRKLSVDYDPLPTTQGWVRTVDVNRQEFEVEIEESVDLPDRDYFTSAQVKWGIFKDRSRPRALKPGTHNMCPLHEWWQVAPRRSRYRTSAWYPMETIEPGDPFVQLARVNTSPIVSLWRSEDVTIDRVRVFASPGAGFVAQLCSRLNLLGVHVEPAKGRWQCLCADGFYCIANRIGPWVEDCLFDATGDDCIILKTWGANAIQRTGARGILLEPRRTWREGAHVFAAQVGDTIRVCDPTRCELLAEFKVLAAERVSRDDPKSPWRITTDRDVDAIKLGNDRRDPIYFNDDITSSHFLVRGNTFRNIRRWGLLCMSHDGLIEHNTFDRTSAQAVLFTSNDAGFRDSDGFVARRVTVRHNTFNDCYTQRPAEYRQIAATITSVVIAGVEREYQSDIVGWRGHENLVIDHNRFLGQGTYPAIWLGNVNGASVCNNIFEIQPEKLTRSEEATITPRIRVSRASDVTISENGQKGRQTSPMVDIDEATTERIRLR